MKIKEFYVGKTAKANHPITCLNPNSTFKIVDVEVSWHPVALDWVVKVRGESTMWFGLNMWQLVEEVVANENH